ncbi:ABC transporter ATP-binding protein [Olivibacter ginsenosidimutans]|uniref:ABC transporter ATP-binding protein n=1 Tax=Olivibacter ginsenosidimutans TaxID=1176537 RepID=A0ABP9AN74_9SPHI
MLEIVLEDIGRRFNRDWIFRGINCRFVQGNSYAILGANGSGKSTLLQIILSSLSPSEGQINYLQEGRLLEIADFFSYVSLAAPYQELIEEFTLVELLEFHFSFKRIIDDMDLKKLLSLLGLEQSAHKEIRYFSSGMKQRTKLAMACCAATPVVLLDEPTSNLDVKGIDWYHQLIQQFGANKLLIICSNQAHEYDFCQHQLMIEGYK